MVSPLLLGLVLMADPRAKAWNVSGGAAVELRGGFARPQPNSETIEPSIMATLTPNVALIYQDRRRGRRIVLEYSPRLYTRYSESYNPWRVQEPPRPRGVLGRTSGPLVTHQVSASYSGSLSRNWSWQGSAVGSIADVDVITANAVIGDQQSVSPDIDFFTVGAASGGVTFTGLLAPLHAVTLTPTVVYQRPLFIDRIASGDGEDSAASTALPEQLAGTLAVGYVYTASPVDSLTVTGGGGYVDFCSRGAQATGNVDAAWLRRLRPRLDSGLSLGGLLAVRTRPAGGDAIPDFCSNQDINEETIEAGSSSVAGFPTVNAELVGQLVQRSRFRLSGRINLGNVAYFDPVQGAVLPQVGGGLTLAASFPPQWSVGINGSLYTTPLASLVAEYDVNNDGELGQFTTMDADGNEVQDIELSSGIRGQQSNFALRTPITYEIDRHNILEFGTIVSARGPSLGDPAVRNGDLCLNDQGEPSPGECTFRAIEAWLYVSFRTNYTSGRINFIDRVQYRRSRKRATRDGS